MSDVPKPRAPRWYPNNAADGEAQTGGALGHREGQIEETVEQFSAYEAFDAGKAPGCGKRRLEGAVRICGHYHEAKINCRELEALPKKANACSASPSEMVCFDPQAPMNSSAGKKAKIIHELRQLVAIFLYLAAFFIVLRVYTHLVLLEHQISYVAYGLTTLKALVLAKIILMGETLHLGRRFHNKPLIISTVYNTLVFSAFAFVFEVVEHLVLGAIHGNTFGAVLGEIGEKGWPHLVGMALVVFVAFLPFFAFRPSNALSAMAS